MMISTPLILKQYVISHIVGITPQPIHLDYRHTLHSIIRLDNNYILNTIIKACSKKFPQENTINLKFDYSLVLTKDATIIEYEKVTSLLHTYIKERINALPEGLTLTIIPRNTQKDRADFQIIFPNYIDQDTANETITLLRIIGQQP